VQKRRFPCKGNDCRRLSTKTLIIKGAGGVLERETQFNLIMRKSRIKKIIFLLDNHFCERDYNRFGIELLEANGFEVLVWELTPIINPDSYNNVIVPDPIKYKGHRIFSEIYSIKDNISSLGNDCFFVLFSNYCLNFYRILRSISRKNFPYCFDVSGGSFPFPKDYVEFSCKQKLQMLLWKILNKIKNINYNSFKEYIFRHIPYKLLFLKPADIIITGAAKSNIHLYRFPLGEKTKILKIHYYDYDNYLAEMRKTSIIDKTIGVFLDQYLPFHPDYIFDGCSPSFKAEKYYGYLRNFFDYLEGTFQVKIIIAGHPRSHYEDSQDYFGGRIVIRNKTCELVRGAGFVVAHHSYSINYAVLFSKPILFLTSDDFEKGSDGPYINVMANMLGKKPIFMDKPYTFDWEQELSVDTAKYREYKQNHIKMDGTEELPFWQVVANYIKSHY
jgi:hypothetical protein